ncbi:MAG: FHA domain-containing protein [bacterium]|nr:FHA domain-containing protein [bacterium]
MPQLIIKLGEQVVQKYSFDKELISIGRAIDNEVVIDNLAVSRRHCQITKEEGKFIITDLKSANGTFVNGERVNRRILKHNDVISIGKHKIFYLEDVRFTGADPHREFDFDRTIIVAEPEPSFLVLLQGKAEKSNFKLDKAELYIGRDAGCDVVLADWMIAKQHAKLTRQGKNYYITDLGTWKGTKVNGEPIKGDRLLFHKDIIEIGTARLQFLVSDIEEMDHLGIPLAGPIELEPEIGPAVPATEAADKVSKFSTTFSAPKGEYVASVSSPIFHFLDCNWAKGIAEKNRIYFATVGDAILSRRRSCRTCNPGMQNKDIEFWLKMLSDRDASVRRHAVANLKKLTGKDYSKETEL